MTMARMSNYCIGDQVLPGGGEDDDGDGYR